MVAPFRCFRRALQGEAEAFRCELPQNPKLPPSPRKTLAFHKGRLLCLALCGGRPGHFLAFLTATVGPWQIWFA